MCYSSGRFDNQCNSSAWNGNFRPDPLISYWSQQSGLADLRDSNWTKNVGIYHYNTSPPFRSEIRFNVVYEGKNDKDGISRSRSRRKNDRIKSRFHCMQFNTPNRVPIKTNGHQVVHMVQFMRMNPTCDEIPSLTKEINTNNSPIRMGNIGWGD